MHNAFTCSVCNVVGRNNIIFFCNTIWRIIGDGSGDTFIGNMYSYFSKKSLNIPILEKKLYREIKSCIHLLKIKDSVYYLSLVSEFIKVCFDYKV